MIDPQDRAHCKEAIRHGSLSFHAASKLLPNRVRDPALALYAFCRVADDEVDLTRDKAAALARLQGNTNYAKVPNADMPNLLEQAKAQCFSPVHYARWSGEDSALQSADSIIADHPLPRDLRLEWLSADTQAEVRASFGAMALGCGVLPPALEALTGQVKPGMTLLAVTAEGHVVSCAAAVGFLNSQHPDTNVECWWGMLATDPDWRGQRLSLILGARVIQEMAQQHGFRRFFTGIEPGNAPSEAVCKRLGLSDTAFSILGIADASLLPGGRMTK